MNRSIGLLCISTLLLTGCAAHWPEQNPSMKGPTEVFDIPPKELMARIKVVIAQPPMSLGIEQDNDGSILTTPQRFPGAWHILRRWQEQTRYRITISPDFSNPTGRARIEVREFTETRATDGMVWTANEPLPRPERAQALMDEIRKRINNPSPTTSTTNKS